MSNSVRRAAVILRDYKLRPYYGIVFFDDTSNGDESILQWGNGLHEAVRKHFIEHRDSPEEFEDYLDNYRYFYIPLGIAEALVNVEVPTIDVGHLDNSDDAAQIIIEQLMITVCMQFAYIVKSTKGEE